MGSSRTLCRLDVRRPCSLDEEAQLHAGRFKGGFTCSAYECLPPAIPVPGATPGMHPSGVPWPPRTRAIVRRCASSAVRCSCARPPACNGRRNFARVDCSSPARGTPHRPPLRAGGRSSDRSSTPWLAVSLSESPSRSRQTRLTIPMDWQSGRDRAAHATPLANALGAIGSPRRPRTRRPRGVQKAEHRASLTRVTRVPRRRKDLCGPLTCGIGTRPVPTAAEEDVSRRERAGSSQRASLAERCLGPGALGIVGGLLLRPVKASGLASRSVSWTRYDFFAFGVVSSPFSGQGGAGGVDVAGEGVNVFAAECLLDQGAHDRFVLGVEVVPRSVELRWRSW